MRRKPGRGATVSKNRGKFPTCNNPAKERLLAKITQQFEAMRRPRPGSLAFATFRGISAKNAEFLSAPISVGTRWPQALWLAASDLHGNGHSIEDEDVLAILMEAAGAWDQPERQDQAIRVIANAYSRTPRSAAEYMQERQARGNDR